MTTKRGSNTCCSANAWMKEMFDEGFQNSMNGSTAALKTEIDKFISFFDSTMKENDEFMIV